MTFLLFFFFCGLEEMSKDKKNCPTDFLNISVLIVFKMCRKNATSYWSQVFHVVTTSRLMT